jgi:hypothetical protein
MIRLCLLYGRCVLLFACAIFVATSCASTTTAGSADSGRAEVSRGRCFVTPKPHTYRYAKLCLIGSKTFTVHEIQHVPDATLDIDCAGAVIYRSGTIELRPARCQRSSVDEQRGRPGRPKKTRRPSVTVQQTKRGLRMPSLLGPTTLQLRPEK